MKYFLLLGALLCSNDIIGQKVEWQDSTTHQLWLKSGVLVSSAERAPFWMSANNSQRFGSMESNQLYTNIFLFKTSRATEALDYDYGIETIANFDGSANTRLIQAYVGLSTKLLRLSAGRMEEIFGLNDYQYGFGHLVNGNNALTLPKISLSTNGWIKAPFLKNNISYRAYLSHGWFEKNRYQSGAFLHQKYFYVNIHPKSKKFGLSFGLTHNAQWGGYNIDNESEQPVGFKNYAKIFFASSGGSDALENDKLNALGNHLGTWDLKGSVEFGDWTFSNYWQFLWEDRSGLTPFNWRDGLMGITLKNNSQKAFITAINLEIIRTNDQDAEKVRKDGTSFLEPDNFLNNSVYKSGWTYKNSVMGSPVFLLLNESATSLSTIKNMINGVNVSVTGRLHQVDFKMSFREFTNGGTRFESIDPKLRVKALILEANLNHGNSRFLFQAEYDWGNYLGKNLGVKIEYQFDLSNLISKH